MNMPLLPQDKHLAGVTTIGSNENNGVLQANIKFPQPFPPGSNPIVLVNALQGQDYQGNSIPDTFAVTVTSTSSDGFSLNVWRTDANGGSWGQNLRCAYLAVL